MATMIPLSKINWGPALAVRGGLRPDHVDDLAIAYADKKELPPISLWKDSKGNYHCGDGAHRGEGRAKAGFKEIPADITVGEERNAILYACSSNETHGLKRTREDRGRALAVLLADDEWKDRSKSWLADAAGVSEGTVERALANRNGTARESVAGKDGKTYPARRPRKKKGEPKNGDVVEEFDRKLVTEYLGRTERELDKLCRQHGVSPGCLPRKGLSRQITAFGKDLDAFVKQLKRDHPIP